jgi:hypothetical protein
MQLHPASHENHNIIAELPASCGNIIDVNHEMDVVQAAAWMGMSDSTFLRWRRRWKVIALTGGRFSKEQLVAGRRRESAAKGGPL